MLSRGGVRSPSDACPVQRCNREGAAVEELNGTFRLRCQLTDLCERLGCQRLGHYILQPEVRRRANAAQYEARCSDRSCLVHGACACQSESAADIERRVDRNSALTPGA